MTKPSPRCFKRTAYRTLPISSIGCSKEKSTLVKKLFCFECCSTIAKNANT